MMKEKNSNFLFFALVINFLMIIAALNMLKLINKPKIFVAQTKIVTHDDKDYYTIVLNSAIKKIIDNKEIKIYLLTKKIEIIIWVHIWIYDHYLVVDKVDDFYNEEKVWVFYKNESLWEFIFSD